MKRVKMRRADGGQADSSVPVARPSRPARKAAATKPPAPPAAWERVVAVVLWFTTGAKLWLPYVSFASLAFAVGLFILFRKRRRFLARHSLYLILTWLAQFLFNSGVFLFAYLKTHDIDHIRQLSTVTMALMLAQPGLAWNIWESLEDSPVDRLLIALFFSGILANMLISLVGIVLAIAGARRAPTKGKGGRGVSGTVTEMPAVGNEY